MKFLKQIRDGLMGVEYEREYDDEDNFDYIEDFDDERESPLPSFFSRFDRNRDNRDDRDEDRPPIKKRNSKTAKEPTRSSRREIESYDQPRSPRRHSSDPKVLNHPNAFRGNSIQTEEILLCKPVTLEDARPVCECLKNNIICVINLESVDKATAQRIADFLGGVCDALNGGIQRISHDIFLIAPDNIVITSQIKDELKKNSRVLPWIQSAFR